MSKTSPHLTTAEYESLDCETLQDLNYITQFYYDVIQIDSRKGIVKKVTPRQFYDFIKKNKRATAKSKAMSTPEPNTCGG